MRRDALPGLVAIRSDAKNSPIRFAISIRFAASMRA